LGPGAEIGIYYTDSLDMKNAGVYDIDPDGLKVKANMKIIYDGYRVNLANGNGLLNDFSQTNWWITSFSPWVADYEAIKEEYIHVYLDVTFEVDPDQVGGSTNGHLGTYNSGTGTWSGSLWPLFKAEAINKQTFFNAWSDVTLASQLSGYQFSINY